MNKQDVEADPEELPYKTARALNSWRKAARNRLVLEATKTLAFKSADISGGRPLSDETAKLKCRATKEWGDACDEEADQESAYYLYDKLLWIELKKKDNG